MKKLKVGDSCYYENEYCLVESHTLDGTEEYYCLRYGDGYSDFFFVSAESDKFDD